MMLANLKTLEADINATAEDPAFEKNLPEIEKGDEVLGTLNPFLRKFLCLIEIRQNELQKAVQDLGGMPLSEEEQKKKLCGASLLNAEIQVLVQIFWTEVADSLVKTTYPDMWEKAPLLTVKKGWQVVGIDPQNIAKAVLDAVRNTMSGEEMEDEWTSPQPPIDKRRLN